MTIPYDPSNEELFASAEAKRARRIAECRRPKCRRRRQCCAELPRPCAAAALHPLTEAEIRAQVIILMARLKQRVWEEDEQQMKERQAAELRRKAEQRRARRRGELLD
jgi:hypothetical protein